MILTAIVFGFLGSLHCLGMCGPIAFLLPVDRENNWRKIGQLALYHGGRLMAYGIIGLLFGFLGKGLALFGIQQKLSIAVGIMMVVLVLWPRRNAKANKLAAPVYRLIGKVKSKLGAELKKKSADTFLTIGFLNGFLPCGLVYMATLGAIAMGNTFQAGLYMVLFGVGTIPLMTTVVFSSKWLKGPIKAKVKKAIPIFVILVGLLFIVRGLGLGIPYVSPKISQNDMATAKIECHQP
ncbi:sulfite exporter TauE/SafE family protein [Flagellimonas sp.]|uniref:sulfite exporter TauE/SafE family protein n=1 Tax=Flagellimonas sp. TaxID=2058762 RepID=UPI003F4A7658